MTGRVTRTIRQKTVTPKHQKPAGEPHSVSNEGEFIVPVNTAPSAFVATTEFVVQLETPQASADLETGPTPAQEVRSVTESPKTLRKAA